VQVVLFYKYSADSRFVANFSLLSFAAYSSFEVEYKHLYVVHIAQTLYTG